MTIAVTVVVVEEPAVPSPPARAHAFAALEEEARGSYCLVCTCGWRSSASRVPAGPGREWDRHRRVSGWG